MTTRERITIEPGMMRRFRWPRLVDHIAHSTIDYRCANGGERYGESGAAGAARNAKREDSRQKRMHVWIGDVCRNTSDFGETFGFEWPNQPPSPAVIGSGCAPIHGNREQGEADGGETRGQGQRPRGGDSAGFYSRASLANDGLFAGWTSWLRGAHGP
ncbi:MAG: hypothetical protein ABI322_00875 [Gemmatimonadaceae bacterium]